MTDHTSGASLRWMLLYLIWLIATPQLASAAFTKTFTISPDAPASADAATPFLWTALLNRIDRHGRGPVAPPPTATDVAKTDSKLMIGGFTSLVHEPQVAETAPLQWDGTSTSLEFFINIMTTGELSWACPKDAPFVTLYWMSHNQSVQARTAGNSSSNWQPLWNSSGSWADTNYWIGVRVPLPAAATTPSSFFAFKWVNTDPGTDPLRSRCTVAYLDDITFPAQLPTADNLGVGVGPESSLPADSSQCKVCRDVCELVLGHAAMDKLTSNALGRAGLGGSTPG